MQIREVNQKETMKDLKKSRPKKKLWTITTIAKTVATLLENMKEQYQTETLLDRNIPKTYAR